MVPVGADDDATLLGGLGIDGKNDSLTPLGKTVPFVGNVGDPEEEKGKNRIKKMRPSCVSGAPYGASLDVTCDGEGIDWIKLSQSGHQMREIPKDLRSFSFRSGVVSLNFASSILGI